MRRSDSHAWLAAKAQGDEAELAIAGWFRGRGYQVTKSLGAESFDLLLQARLEVKNDLRAETSGRVAVEVSYRGQPSGLMTTSASWFAIVVGREAILSKTDALRECVLSGKYPTCLGGDNKSSELVLVPISELRGLKQTFVISLDG